MPRISDDMVPVLLTSLRDKDWYIVRNSSFILNHRMGADAPDVISYTSRRTEAEEAIAFYNDWWSKYVAKKKAEMTAEMQRAADLLHMYVPPDPERIQKSKDAGKASMTPVEPGGPARLTFSDYLLEGDTFSITLDPANGLVGASVKSYLDAPKNGVHLDVSFANLPDGASYPATVDLVVESEKIHVKVEQSGHRKAAP